jgi:hypothetical protein
MESLMERDNILGKMVQYMLENLRMVLSMVKANGEVEKGLNAIHMKEIMLKIRRMVMEYSNGQVGTYIRENIEKMKEMVSGRCAGQTAAFIKENGQEEFSMDQAR